MIKAQFLNRKRQVFSILLFSVIPFCTKAQSIAVGGTDWNTTVQSTTIGSAGTDYTTTYESASNQILVTGSVSTLFGSSNISARYIPNPTWHPSLTLSLRRTNGGNGCLFCGISGGSTYQDISQTATYLFTISGILGGTYSNIPVQVKISGASVTIPSGSYSANIVFTITAS